MLRLFILFVFLSICGHLQAQEPAYLHYTIDEGLPSNEVYNTYEDKNGYIWFATDHGISKFDGYSFSNFSTSDGLVHNTVFGFYEDHRGRVWMRTLNSSLCYMEQEIIHPYPHNDQLKSFLGRDFIQRFAFDRAGNLWFICVREKMGLFKQDALSGKVEKIDLPDGYNAFIKELDSGELIAGIDADNKYIANQKVDNTLIHSGDTWLFRMHEATTSTTRRLVICKRIEKNSFLFSYDAQLVRIENGMIIHRREFSSIINTIYIDSSKNTWLCTNGFLKIDKGLNTSSVFFSNLIATSVICDRMGNYWFTTLNNGIYLARNLEIQTLNHVGQTNMNELKSLDIIGNQLIALNQNGNVFQLPLFGNAVDTAHSTIFKKTFPNINLSGSIPQRNLLFLGDDIFELDRSGSFIFKAKVAENCGSGGIRSYARSGDSLLVAGNLQWCISNLGQRPIYNSRNDGFVQFCTAIGTENAKEIWIGTIDGLFIFKNGKTVPYDSSVSIFRQRVTDIAFGKFGEVIISTRGAGLIIIDGKKIYNLRKSDGLSSDQCGNIYLDNDTIWLCSNNGLNRIQINRNKGLLEFDCRQINTEHGLPSNMINDVLRYGNLIFLATGKGLTWFDISKFKLNTIPPPVYIRAFQVNNQQTNPEKNELNWKDRNISIHFISLLFRGKGNVHYRYRLEGYEENWNYTTDRVARYFNLPKGNYTFIVSAMNENQIWNEQPAVIHFTIPAHFTETIWFRVLLILAIAASASFVVFLFVRQQRDRARAKLAMALAEQKALRAQMKPHFIFNSLNSIQHFILDHDVESAHLYLSQFSSLMRMIMDNTLQNTIRLTREVETLRLYLDLEKLRFGENFNYTINVAAEIPTDTIELPPMLIQPYVENAIWHGLLLLKDRPPQLLIQFSLDNEKIICVIEDNGIGRKQSAIRNRGRSHESTGMKNIAERIELLNRETRTSISVMIIDLEDGAGNACGTRVTLEFYFVRKKNKL